MDSSVTFRDFDEKDIDFIYKCKNNEKLNSLIVGQFRPFTYDEARRWVEGCMGEHDTFRFWAVCANDEEQRIIGWISLSQIDKDNQSACFHGIVIGDESYHDGFAWIESYLFIMNYTFEVLQLNRLYGSSLVGHHVSNQASEVFLWTTEGVMRQAVMKNGRFYDLKCSSILKDEYFQHLSEGAYTTRSILKRIRQLRKNKKLY